MQSPFRKYSGFSNYCIFNSGLIYDLQRQIYISQNASQDGYLCVTLRSDEGKRKTFKVHRLVAGLFCQNRFSKPEVNHINGIKIDNHYTNLEWVTHSENIQHAWDNGLIVNTIERALKISYAQIGKNRGANNHASRPVRCITTDEVFDCMMDAHRKYNVPLGGISRVCNNSKNRKYAGVHPETGEKLQWEFYNG